MHYVVRLAPQRLATLRRSLLAWYDANRRDLPWRETRDPYRIWVSEVMLQQTRVAVVLSRYEQFLMKFPTVRHLASARIATVLAQWSGLGYYRRARNLHAAARVIVKEQGSRIPRTAEAWRELPGVGRYTAAAIASIAFAESVAVLDGNVERVLGRLSGDARSTSECWSAAQCLLDPKRPGDFNQAMMELGATVCLPGEPHCDRCPIARFCRTRGRGKAQARRRRQLKRSLCYGLAIQDDTVLLVRRSEDEDLMPGMWELPALTIDSARGLELLFRVRHSITVADYSVSVRDLPLPLAPAGKWAKVSQLARLPLTGLSRKILCKAKLI